MIETQIVQINTDDLIKADWNYKTDGTDEQITKLMNSIKEDKSIGVLAVREIDNDKFEVIDGNHRLEAIIRLGWGKIPCENFGSITKAKAIIIARRRNHKWFEDDILSYAELFTNDVLSEYSIEELEKFMPETKKELEDLEKLVDFDWSDFDGEFKYDEENLKTIKVVVPDETYNMWLAWKEKIKDVDGYETDSKAFEYAIVEANNLTLKDG